MSMKVELLNSMGSDLTVVNAARVSFHKEATQLDERDIKLIHYLAKHGHWTPFGHAFLSFRIKAPIFLARQLVKHQVGLVWNEVSRRYVDEPPEYWMPTKWRGRPDGSIKQGSVEADFPDWISPTVEAYLSNCTMMYNDLLEAGIAPEMARMVLPLNSMTEWWWSGSLMAFARIYNLRSEEHAQKEAQDFAEELRLAVPKCFTHSWEALTGVLPGEYQGH